MQVTSISPFSHNIFYPSPTKFLFFIHIYFVVCKCFQLDQSKILCFRTELILGTGLVNLNKYESFPCGVDFEY